MLIRVFSVRPVTAMVELLRTVGTVEVYDPMKWAPSYPADIHIHVDFTLRLAVPWAGLNVVVADEPVAGLMTVPDITAETMARILATPLAPPALPLTTDAAKVAKPKVGIITLTRNRKAWWPNMLQNVVKQNWPADRMEWIIVDDSDEDQRLVTEVEAFMEKSPGIMIRYVELAPRSIGFKRNVAVEAAGEDVSVFVVMDDDDHYPANSVATRVAWLGRDLPEEVPQSQIGFCTVLPVYDLTRYISAMSVADIVEDVGARMSEASLIFTRGAWKERPFPDVGMAEGAGFVGGREAVTVEYPPKDVIVSFIHTGNTSSRRIPADQPPNGCHYGFSNEFFTYLHMIGGGKE